MTTVRWEAQGEGLASSEDIPAQMEARMRIDMSTINKVPTCITKTLPSDQTVIYRRENYHGMPQKKLSMWLSLQKGAQPYSSKSAIDQPSDLWLYSPGSHTDLRSGSSWVGREDGNITAIGHESQEDALSHTPHRKTKLLGDAC